MRLNRNATTGKFTKNYSRKGNVHLLCSVLLVCVFVSRTVSYLFSALDSSVASCMYSLTCVAWRLFVAFNQFQLEMQKSHIISLISCKFFISPMDTAPTPWTLCLHLFSSFISITFYLVNSAINRNHFCSVSPTGLSSLLWP